jgi:transglutaminase-like putative cysteine protease
MRTFVAIASILFLSACSQGTSQDHIAQPMNGGDGKAGKSCCSSEKAGASTAAKDSCCSEKGAASAAAKKEGCCAEKASAAKAGECDKAGSAEKASTKTECDKAKGDCEPQSKASGCPMEAAAAKKEGCCAEKASAAKAGECDKAGGAEKASTKPECDKAKGDCDPQSKAGRCPMEAAAAQDDGCCAGKSADAKKDCCKETATIATSAPVAVQDAGKNQQVVDRKFLKPGDTRTFAVEYVGKVGPIPAGTKKLRVWFPVPQDSTVQSIKNLSFSTQPKIGTESKYGNKLAYWEIENPAASVEMTMKFECSRLEVVTDLAMLKSEGTDPSDSYGVFRAADKLVLVDDEIRKLADEVCAGKTTAVDKARAIYDYVLKRMTYDKNHDGWGKGSTRHACDVGKGNCTDFHALFNSLCRAQGIASGFEIGLYLPYERKKDEKLGGYHCWALFRVPGKTWVPVDASEADRFPDRAEYFFGGHTSNRVTLSTGRDITLEPKQDGDPVNYILNPYAEADGKSVKTDKAWSYKDLD